MKTCSETIKACGLKSTKQVADLNGLTPRTIQKAFRENPSMFVFYVLKALDEQCTLRRVHADNYLEKVGMSA